ncbi:putative bifunctional diguanylate cyclase/phosphodiesterase [Deinococcus yavapaiensis]|uniref:putative bifunctional diguanylate cyclase/phosphodiesterase n=1 Tax=Deinococcus yavapaiensis TaxID=309889 RepID=UPI0011B680D1|nr:EAL domain-containing protein [Deinococcus yavapaiensis]
MTQHLSRLNQASMSALLCLAVAHTLWTLTGAFPLEWRPYLGNLIYFPLCLLAGFVTFVHSRILAERERRAWRWFTYGILSWGAGQAVYTYLDLNSEPTFPSLADVGYLALIPCFLAGVVHLLRSTGTFLRTLTYVLDVAIVLSAAGDVVWHTYVQQAIEGYVGQPVPLVIALTYPLLDLLLLALTLAMLMWRPQGLRSLQIAALVGGFALFLTADILYAFQSAQGTYQLGRPLDTFWTWGIVAVASAAYAGPRIATPRRVARIPTRPYGVVLPSAAILVSYALYFVTQVGRKAVTFDGGVAVVSLVVFTRQLVALLDNHHLAVNLAHQAAHDPLTGLLNRSALQERLQEAIDDGAALDERVAVLFIDLDRMKHVNDNLGHTAGDHVLRTIGARLASLLQDADFAARFGGDEFVVVLPGSDEAAATVFARRLLDAIAQPIVVHGKALHVTASVGVAMCPDDARDVDAALQRADVAMYQAKGYGKNTFRFVDAQTHETHVQLLQLEEHLRRALRHDALELHYQPLVRLSDDGHAGFEALLRWNSALLDSVPPHTIIKVAEQHGMMHELGAWVLRRAVRQVGEWRRDGLKDASVSVNVTASQFAHADFARDVVALLAEHDVPASALVLEVTESTLIVDLQDSAEKMTVLRQLGVRVALDDFGTGYSSLSYLRQLPVDILKLDRSFVRTLNDGSEVFVQAIVSLAHHQGALVVAEGVEDAWQVERVRALRCDWAQGYWFAKPMAPDEVRALVARTSEEDPGGVSPNRSAT